ncbi:hypothetical protein HOU02_gp465 [Caulobacter phage CcrBL9]|uniref:Uncharacterized protein n=1 Tax=Caulobacter phage CcrBL9 TaxID=2283270 RepID=A0A385EC77_9CAUD|nr:hypothetical protein HOU02_gp465 [Caulobacter phage CcrBL9]AXQ69260.1 hypothetical protein CcrBL9_gp236c [Caulobacter phage CcrBL9]
MPYQRKPVVVEAFAWDRHADQSTWPQWAQDFEGLTSLNTWAKIGMSGYGTLLVPSEGKVHEAQNGYFLVRVNKHRIDIYAPAVFAEQFEEVGAAPAAVEPVEAAPAVSEPEKASPAKGRAAKTEAAPAADAGADEA